MKLWDKGTPVNELIEKFTVGKDRELDLYLAKFDVLGSIAHAKMLQSIDLLTAGELAELQTELIEIYYTIENGNFRIEEGVEDVHSQVELMLTRKLGDTGKKIHSGRSRNDQVLLDLKLFTRSEIQKLVEAVSELFKKLMSKAEANKQYLMPGYTHLQVAMPSSFGLWFSAYAESLVDDLVLLQAAYKITNQNPLGSAAGYGSSFPLDRQMTTVLLGFESMNYNVIYAQMGRGKIEKTVAFGLSSVAATISKFAFDVCLFMSQNFGFVSLPNELTTGSSIMPHKKNPDVFELVRSHCNKIQAIPYQISLMTNNLPSGYFRDLQILKEVFLPAFQELLDCIHIAGFAIDNMIVNTDLMNDDRYRNVFSVEDVNKLVQQGVPFRDAYKQVGSQINAGTYEPSREISHTHQGSIGNLCLEQISDRMKNIIQSYEFQNADKAYANLLKQL
ncbi:MAG: argininosuccinate lyase [Bacteroidia bacterium]